MLAPLSQFPKWPLFRSQTRWVLGALVTALFFGQTQAGALEPDEARKKGAEFLNHWGQLRTGALYGRDYWAGQPDYFAQLRTLGGALDEPGANSLGTGAPADAAVEILLAAHDAARQPSPLEVLRGWYGMPRNFVTKAFLAAQLPKDEESAKLIAAAPEAAVATTMRWPMASVPFGLRPEHTKPAYRLAWEALLLSPPTPERTIMDKHVFEALQTIKDPRSIPLLIEHFRQHVEIVEAEYWNQPSTKVAIENALQTLGSIQTPESLEAFLKCLSLAEAQNRADRQPRDMMRFSIRDSILRQLGGEDFKGHRRFEALMKARLAAAQSDPNLHALDLSQRGLLEEALRRAAKTKSAKRN